jgi:glycosyltransferase involved in cell wall biosynthesis
MTNEPVVGIVTRTKNRRVLLKRALESVLFQTYPHWIMVIVNDGGDRDDVDALVASYAAQARGRVRVVHNDRSMGMEGASKLGLGTLDTELLAVHDDDDSWAPEFLAVTVRELRQLQATYPGVQGVTTYANVVMETVHGNVVQIDSVEPFNGWVPAGFLSLDRLLASNFVPPISFLFTRQAFEDVGGLYEAIPYLGDWDFLIRMLSKYEVFMIPQYLAFYHWRSRSQSGVLGNSVTGEVARHKFYKQLLLNQWLRADIAAGRFGIGAYANLRAHVETLLHQTREREAAAPAAPAPATAPAAAMPADDAAAAPPIDGDVPQPAVAAAGAPAATDHVAPHTNGASAPKRTSLRSTALAWFAQRLAPRDP